MRRRRSGSSSRRRKPRGQRGRGGLTRNAAIPFELAMAAAAMAGAEPAASAPSLNSAVGDKRCYDTVPLPIAWALQEQTSREVLRPVRM